MRPTILLAAAALSGCASMHAGSYVSPGLSEADAPAIAQGVVGFVNLREGPAAGPIALSSPAGDVILTPRIESALRVAGYTVSPAGRRSLGYQVDQRGDGALLRLTLDGMRASRPYIRAADSSLIAAGPYAVTITGAAR